MPSKKLISLPPQKKHPLADKVPLTKSRSNVTIHLQIINNSLGFYSECDGRLITGFAQKYTTLKLLNI